MMISIVIFTYKRLDKLNKCLKSIESSSIKEILIFNDDENQILNTNMLDIDPAIVQLIRIFNPQDFGFNDRAFRKPIYLNKSVKLAKTDTILFSDDDGIFYKNAIGRHVKALEKNVFCAGAIIKGTFLNRQSKSILQGTNYSFQKHFFYTVGGYDEAFVNSNGSGDVDFWYRIYNIAKNENYPVAFLQKAIQKVAKRSQRKKNDLRMNPRDYTLKKHNLQIQGPMYKWFPNIRNKKQWMNIINE